MHPQNDGISEAPVVFEVLYREHVEGVRRHVRRRVADRDLAEDVVQETFMRVYRFLDRLDPSRPAGPWIRAIASTMAMNAVRGRRHAVETLHEDPTLAVETGRHQLSGAGLADPEEECLRTEQRHRVTRVLKTLPGRQQAVLVLKEVDGLSCTEIAEIEGSSAVTVKAALARARAAYRRADAASTTTPVVVGAGLSARVRGRLGRLSEWARAMGAVACPLSEHVASVVVAVAVGTVLLADQPGSSFDAFTAARDAAYGPALELDLPSPTGLGTRPAASRPSEATGPRRPPDPVPTAGVAAVGGTGGLDVDAEELSLDAELWARLGAEEPAAGLDVDLRCDGSVRRRACEAVRSVPDPPSP